jgi:molybdenum cofactor cytidylyltransferase
MQERINPTIEAIVLAAGLSTRMGQPKMVMPWGPVTVIGKVITTLLEAGIGKIIVVTGGAAEAVSAAIRPYAVQQVFNPDYRDGEMMRSIQVGLRSLADEIRAALLVLGDQPQIEAGVIRQILSAYYETGNELIVPSYQMRRGHPWLVGRGLWPDILSLEPPANMRDFFSRKNAQIYYVTVETASVLKDIDTPEEYERQRPRPDTA